MLVARVDNKNNLVGTSQYSIWAGSPPLVFFSHQGSALDKFFYLNRNFFVFVFLEKFYRELLFSFLEKIGLERGI